MIEVLQTLREFLQSDKTVIVFDSFLRQINSLVENFGEGTSDHFWAEILNTILSYLREGKEFYEEIYAKSRQR